MASSTNIPHIHTTGVTAISPLDWNAYMTMMHTPTRVTSGPHTITNAMGTILYDTDGGAITANLPIGANTRGVKIKNVGSSSNAVTIVPNGAETIEEATVYDGECAELEYNATEGWVWT